MYIHVDGNGVDIFLVNQCIQQHRLRQQPLHALDHEYEQLELDTPPPLVVEERPPSLADSKVIVSGTCVVVS